MPESLRDRYQYYTCASTAKLRRFGYERPVTSLEDSVKDCIRNYFSPDKHLGDE